MAAAKLREAGFLQDVDPYSGQRVWRVELEASISAYVHVTVRAPDEDAARVAAKKYARNMLFIPDFEDQNIDDISALDVRPGDFRDAVETDGPTP